MYINRYTCAKLGKMCIGKSWKSDLKQCSCVKGGVRLCRDRLGCILTLFMLWQMTLMTIYFILLNETAIQLDTDDGHFKLSANRMMNEVTKLVLDKLSEPSNIVTELDHSEAEFNTLFNNTGLTYEKTTGINKVSHFNTLI